MKLYGDFTKEDWLNTFKVKNTQTPCSFIIHGEYKHEINLKMWNWAFFNNDFNCFFVLDNPKPNYSIFIHPKGL